MTLTEKFITDAIQLDSGAEVMYGSDQIYDTYPCRFPTVEFQLSATDALVEVADRIRMEKGYLPMHPRDGRTDDVDCDGWYDFYVGISKLPGDHQQCQLDSSISFVVVNSDSSDNEDMYEIELSESDQEIVLAVLDKQCRRHLGKGCAELLAEAESAMQEDEADKFSMPPNTAEIVPENHIGGVIT